MRKNTSFAIAAIGLALVMTFCARSSVVATSSDVVRPKAGVPYVAPVGSFLPVKTLEPTW